MRLLLVSGLPLPSRRRIVRAAGMENLIFTGSWLGPCTIRQPSVIAAAYRNRFSAARLLCTCGSLARVLAVAVLTAAHPAARRPALAKPIAIASSTTAKNNQAPRTKFQEPKVFSAPLGGSLRFPYPTTENAEGRRGGFLVLGICSSNFGVFFNISDRGLLLIYREKRTISSRS